MITLQRSFKIIVIYISYQLVMATHNYTNMHLLQSKASKTLLLLKKMISTHLCLKVVHLVDSKMLLINRQTCRRTDRQTKGIPRMIYTHLCLEVVHLAEECFDLLLQVVLVLGFLLHLCVQTLVLLVHPPDLVVTDLVLQIHDRMNIGFVEVTRRVTLVPPSDALWK